MSTKNIGTIVQVVGPVLDIRFSEENLPDLLNAIEIDNNGTKLTAEVAQHIGGGLVRCISMNATDGLVRGLEAVDTGGPITVPVGDECLGRMFNLLGDPIDAQEPPPIAHGPAVALPMPELCGPPDFFATETPFLKGIEMRVARGGFRIPGPAAIWYRATRPIVADASISPLMRAVIASDFCNGTSSVFDMKDWTFINADLSVSLGREPVGEWILLDAETWVGPDCVGIAAARLADTKGYFGRAVQSVIFEKR